jgi:hypothetical protein
MGLANWALLGQNDGASYGATSPASSTAVPKPASRLPAVAGLSALAWRASRKRRSAH